METDALQNNSIKRTEVICLKNKEHANFMDDVAMEEPLEIHIAYNAVDTKKQKNISVTMRTPGNDAELALGFLFTEGILSEIKQVKNVAHLEKNTCSRTSDNTIIVEFATGSLPLLTQTERNFYTTSSCGVCGKSSIQSIRTVSPFLCLERTPIKIDIEVLYRLPEYLKLAQHNFGATGGIHASAIFDKDGTLLAIREDVGRHNALDKLIGHALRENLLPLKSQILVLSGRASFELIQKAAMAGIAIVAAIGAPSSLAIELAKEFDITLIGFLRDKRCNIYHLGTYIQIEHIL